MYAIKLNGDGRCKTLIEDIQQSLKILISTPKGTRIFDANYGCDAMAYVDRPQWSMQMLMVDITKQVKRYEPRIELHQIYIVNADTENGAFAIKATFTVIQTNEKHMELSLL